MTLRSSVLGYTGFLCHPTHLKKRLAVAVLTSATEQLAPYSTQKQYVESEKAAAVYDWRSRGRHMYFRKAPIAVQGCGSGLKHKLTDRLVYSGSALFDCE